MIDVSDEQLSAIMTPGNVLVTACPGAGKTRTLIARSIIKADELPSYKKLALITYTNAATDEIAYRLPSLRNLFVGTIHRFCLEYILRPFNWLYDWRKPRIISFDQKREFINKKRNKFNLGWNPVGELEKIRKKPDGTYDMDVSWNNAAIMPQVIKEYADYQENLKVIDFNEILYRSYLIAKDWDFVCTSIANIFLEILVDEFQDTNIFQYEILKLVAKKRRCTFFLVGDQRQAIMTFAGALPESFNKAKNDFQPSCRTLSETYRSTTRIVQTYMSIFPNHPQLTSQAKHKDYDIPVEIHFCGPSSCQHYCNNCIQDVLTVRQILLSFFDAGLEPTEIAILSPWWNDCFKITSHLRREFDFVGYGALPHRTNAIRDTTFEILCALASHNEAPSVRTLRKIKRCVEQHILENSIALEVSKNRTINNLISDFSELSMAQDIQKGLSGIQDILNDIFHFEHSTISVIKERVANSQEPTWTLGRYLRVLVGKEGITNDTIHGAKGLEFKGVILNHIDEGRVPYANRDRASTEDDIINGQKLLYVGLSRAMQYLAVIHSDRPSRFIAGLR